MRRRGWQTIDVRGWEQRLYWHRGTIVDEEVWNAGRLLPSPPRRLPSMTTTVDFCAQHRTRIYADLACQHCGERPVPRISVPTDDAGAA